MWIKVKDGETPIPIHVMHEIKNGLARSKVEMEKRGWENDEVALQLNDLLREIVDLEMGAYFTKFLQVEGFKNGLGAGMKLGFLIGIIASLVCFFVATHW